MASSPIHIMLFNSSDTIVRGLYAMVSEMGIEPIMVKSTDDFLDYPHLSGYIIVILPQHAYQAHEAFIEKYYESAQKVHFMIFSYTENSDDVIHIDDSSQTIQTKIQNTLAKCSKNANVALTPELTTREVEVLKLVALGYTNKEIAGTLFISTHTVISHRKNISEKLGIKTISGLTMYAVIKQLIDIKDLNTENLK